MRYHIEMVPVWDLTSRHVQCLRAGYRHDVRTIDFRAAAGKAEGLLEQHESRTMET